jgi:beta-ketodecanoyl-[acyl-carrier-protein] synthase
MAGVEARDVDAVICAASNHERAYPAIAVEIQQLLGNGRLRLRHERRLLLGHLRHPGRRRHDPIRLHPRALVVNPEICSAHLEWRDRDCHFIFGDVAPRS